jgi:hypothetical protein
LDKTISKDSKDLQLTPDTLKGVVARPWIDGRALCKAAERRKGRVAIGYFRRSAANTSQPLLFQGLATLAITLRRSAAENRATQNA